MPTAAVTPAGETTGGLSTTAAGPAKAAMVPSMAHAAEQIGRRTFFGLLGALALGPRGALAQQKGRHKLGFLTQENPDTNYALTNLSAALRELGYGDLQVEVRSGNGP